MKQGRVHRRRGSITPSLGDSDVQYLEVNTSSECDSQYGDPECNAPCALDPSLHSEDSDDSGLDLDEASYRVMRSMSSIGSGAMSPSLRVILLSVTRRQSGLGVTRTLSNQWVKSPTVIRILILIPHVT